MKHLKALLSASLLVMFLVACAQQADPTDIPITGDIALRIEPEMLAVGSTTLIVTLTDANGSPIDGAALQIHGDMDHEGMASVDREVSESVAGEYRVPFEWSMGGGWIVTVTARMPNGGGEFSETFDYFVDAISSESIIRRSSTAPPAESLLTSAASTDIQIGYHPDQFPARLGEAVVKITLNDVNGMPVTDASIIVTCDMEHTGMLPISGIGAHIGNGHYEVPMRWTMIGDWVVTVSVTLNDGQQIEHRFEQVVIE